MSNSNAVLEMTAAGLDAPCTLRDDDATGAQQPQWQRDQTSSLRSVMQVVMELFTIF